jgi:16S rRNA (guanine(966)-N(2))-methyltransferase RsmD
MRVIAGRYKGRRLETPTWEGLRPTSDKLRETLFNILASRVVGARVLDGFAGTGAVGIEALSRGAAHVTFVERDRRAASLVASNLRRCGIAEGYAIMRRSFDAPGLFGRSDRFDLILLDPPYGQGDLAGRLARAAAWLAPEGVLVLEQARRHPAPHAAGDLMRRREVGSGDSALTFYEWRPEGDARADGDPRTRRPATPAADSDCP